MVRVLQLELVFIGRYILRTVVSAIGRLLSQKLTKDMMTIRVCERTLFSVPNLCNQYMHWIISFSVVIISSSCKM